jgi:hypothetical protein
MGIINTIFYVFKFIYYLIITFPRDVRTLSKLLKVFIKSYFYDKKNLVVSDVFRKWVQKNPNKECIIFNDQTWTFQDVIFKYVFL